MDVDDRLKGLIPKNIEERGRITLDALLAPAKDVLHRRVFPDTPLSDDQITLLLKLLSSMDTDKDPKAARVGEREGRIASPLLNQLSGGFNHGIGRSGHVVGPQPKAPGASLMQQVANSVALDAIRKLGLRNTKGSIIMPLSTGMSIALVLATLRREHDVKRVLYPRIDHKSPRRGIALTGMKIVDIPTVLNGDAVQADLASLEKSLRDEDSVAVLATTTFFPPREPDPVKEIAKLCQETDTPLVINNAYGVQSSEMMARISSAIDAGRVDAIVQSSDKNFLTPVGASIVVSPEEKMIEWTSETYAGRATAAPVVQTFVALLSLGLTRYNKLQQQQVENKKQLHASLSEIAESSDQRVLDVDNIVACAITMDNLDVRNIGAKLYNSRVTGPRAIEKGGFGSCIDMYPHSYLVMNAAIGTTQNDIEMATAKLYKEVKG
ncbi:MAG: O-phosphoseryl-tRNA(Sec) selenium transferase [Promethearchaeota archaeon]